MDIEGQYISPFDDIVEEDDDIDKTTGELTEKGIKKMNTLRYLFKLFEDRNRLSENLLSKLKTRLDETYDSPESKCQEKLKVLMNIYQNKGDEINDEDQFSRFTLRMDMSKSKDRDMLIELSKGRTPAVNSLSLGYIGNDYIEEVLNFITNGFPNKVEALIFNFSGRPKSDKDLLDLSLFIDQLVDKSYLITQELQIWNWVINEDTLNKLMTHFCHLKKLWICWSKFKFEISTKKLLFIMAYEPKLEEISFEGWGDPVINDWEKSTDDLEAILKAIWNSDIKPHINQMLFDDWNLDDSFINEIMNRYGIKNSI